MPEFVIKISTPADLSGAQATQTAIGALTTQTQALTAGTGQAASAQQGAAQAASGLASAATKAASVSFQPLAQSAAEAKGKLSEAEQSATKLIDSLKMGVGIDIGGRIVASIAAIPAAFQEALQAGVHFDQEMEVMLNNFGSAMRAIDPERYLSFGEAKRAGVDAIEIIRRKANELGLEFTSVAHGFAINLAALREGGIKDTEKQVDVMIRLNQLTAAKGITGFQAMRDIIDLLNGMGERTIFGKELAPLGITNETIKQAREMGTLAEFLLTKTQAYSEAAAAGANTAAAAEQRWANQRQQLYGEIAKPVFEALKDGYALLSEEITKPEVREALRGLGYDIATVVEGGAALAAFAVRNANVLVPLGAAIGVVSLALAAYKTAQIAAIIGGRLTTMVAETAAIEAQTVAIAGQTTAVEANTVARTAGGGVGLGSKVGVVGAGIVASVTGFAVGQGLREHFYEGPQAAAMQEQGENSGGRTDRLANMLREIEAAETQDEQTAKRKKLTDELTHSQQELAEAQARMDDKTAAQTKRLPAGIVARNSKDGKLNPEFVDANLKAQIDDLQSYVKLVEEANKQLDGLAGSRTGADIHAKRDAAARELFDKSPYAKSAEAGLDADADEAAKAKHDQDVQKLALRLRKKFSFGTMEAAKAAAEQVITGQEFGKGSAAIEKGLDTVDDRTEKNGGAEALAEKLKGVYQKILDGLPESMRDGLGTTPGDDNLGAIRDAVKNMLVPVGDVAGLREKQKLVEMLKDAVRLQREYNTESEKETKQQAKGDKKDDAEQKKEDAERKQHDDALAAEREETAILQARGRGENDVADTLEKQRDLRREITRLQGQGLSYAEAETAATEKQNAEQAAKDRKFADQKAYESTYQRHPYESGNQYFNRTGRIDAAPTDTDKTGGLHTGGLKDAGGLSTGTLTASASRDRFAGKADAAATVLSGTTNAASSLAGATSAGDLLAKASDYVPTSFSAQYPTAPQLPLDLLPTGLDAARFSPLPTATAGLAPALQNINPAKGSAQPGAGADGAVLTAANGAKTAGQEAAQEMGNAAQSTGQIASAFDGVKTAFDSQKANTKQLRTDLDNLLARVRNLEGP